MCIQRVCRKLKKKKKKIQWNGMGKLWRSKQIGSQTKHMHTNGRHMSNNVEKYNTFFLGWNDEWTIPFCIQKYMFYGRYAFSERLISIFRLKNSSAECISATLWFNYFHLADTRSGFPYNNIISYIPCFVGWIFYLYFPVFFRLSVPFVSFLFQYSGCLF